MRKSKLALYVCTLLLGLGCFLAAALLRETADAALFGALVGVGAGLLGPGGASLLQARFAPEEVRRRQERVERDERNVMLREKAGYVTWYATLLTLAAGALALVVLDNRAAWLLIGVMAVHILFYFGSLIYYARQS